MERRTFLKILGASAAAFRPVQLLEALDSGPEPLVKCLKTGDYLVSASCEVLVPASGFHELRILNGGSVVGLGCMAISPHDALDGCGLLHASINILMKLRCQAGDRLDLEILRNGEPDTKAMTDATLTITEIPS